MIAGRHVRNGHARADVQTTNRSTEPIGGSHRPSERYLRGTVVVQIRSAWSVGNLPVSIYADEQSGVVHAIGEDALH